VPEENLLVCAAHSVLLCELVVKNENHRVRRGSQSKCKRAMSRMRPIELLGVRWFNRGFADREKSRFLASLGMTNFERGWAAVCRVNFMVKLLRAHGGCLGRSRRRRTWQAAISLGEPQAGFDPGISEWGNPRG
jgi:hypothetical protein